MKTTLRILETEAALGLVTAVDHGNGPKANRPYGG
jgi:hypothetical protein